MHRSQLVRQSPGTPPSKAEVALPVAESAQTQFESLQYTVANASQLLPVNVAPVHWQPNPPDVPLEPLVPVMPVAPVEELVSSPEREVKLHVEVPEYVQPPVVPEPVVPLDEFVPLVERHHAPPLPPVPYVPVVPPWLPSTQQHPSPPAKCPQSTESGA